MKFAETLAGYSLAEGGRKVQGWSHALRVWVIDADHRPEDGGCLNFVVLEKWHKEPDFTAPAAAPEV